MATDRAAGPLTELPGVGPARAAQLAALGVRTPAELAWLPPRRYEDRTRLTPVAAVGRGEAGCVLVRVRVTAVARSRPRAGLSVLRARVADDSGALTAVWFNQAHVARWVRPGARLYLYGRVQRSRGGAELVAPEVEPEGEAALAGRMVPVYPLTAGLSQGVLRRLVAAAVQRAESAETLPAGLRRRLGLVDAATALGHLHWPPDGQALAAARRRLAFEELLCLQLGLALRRRARAAARRTFRYAPPGPLSRALRARLPFALTAAQARVLREIDADLRRSRPMDRLLQGDVGSGKTVVAAAALVRAVESGRQGALMAPTEVLAEQHHQRIGPWLGAVGVRVRLLSGSLPPAERAAVRRQLADGEADVVIGTHALLEEDVRFARLGLVVTDEQHRFGVRQRDRLAAKGDRPDVLAMTATPIPRTLALALYGDLDVSTLDELPPGRQPVRTHWRPPAARPRVYAFVAEQLRRGRQAYVVCARIGEDGEPGEDEVVAVNRWAEELRRTWLPGVAVGVLHGRLPAAERDAVMRAFAAGQIACLCATTVVEVGVDVPNASVMVIEGADRFGLAQLHQLRGRVGRGAHASFCILIAPDRGGAVRERLRTLEKTHDGFAIAEADLRLRGPGELLGLRQHGLPELRFADPAEHLDLVAAARDAAAELLAADCDLRAPEHRALRAAVERLFAPGGGEAGGPQPSRCSG